MSLNIYYDTNKTMGSDFKKLIGIKNLTVKCVPKEFLAL